MNFFHARPLRLQRADIFFLAVVHLQQKGAESQRSSRIALLLLLRFSVRARVLLAWHSCNGAELLALGPHFRHARVECAQGCR